MARNVKNPSNFATYEIEEEVWEEGYKYVVGVDEVGRGPGAGPVVAAAVRIPKKYLTRYAGRLKDSKKLTENKRDNWYEQITEECPWAIGRVDNDMIDSINILQATKMAMEIAVNQMKHVDYLLIDGPIRLNLNIPQRPIIKGDTKSISIAAASIVAKATRDEEMRMLHWLHPQYNWIRNKGYLTQEHIEAIQTYGITNYHRTSFRKVGDYIGQR